MLNKIYFLKDTSAFIDVVDIPVDSFLVYREGYKLPTFQGVEYIDFEVFKTKYPLLHINMLIFVGLNKMITPVNRCDMVNDFIQTMTRNIPKISIDEYPFIGEPWRLWYHYDVTNSGKFNIPHGYAIETEWKHWFYRDVNTCRLSGENIKMFIDNTHSDLDTLKMSIKYSDVSDVELSEYETLKSFIINKYSSPKLIINNLLKESNKRYQIDFGFNSYRSPDNYLLPDIGIYRFVAEENLRRLSIYNEVIR